MTIYPWFEASITHGACREDHSGAYTATEPAVLSSYVAGSMPISHLAW